MQRGGYSNPLTDTMGNYLPHTQHEEAGGTSTVPHVRCGFMFCADTTIRLLFTGPPPPEFNTHLELATVLQTRRIMVVKTGVELREAGSPTQQDQPTR